MRHTFAWKFCLKFVWNFKKKKRYVKIQKRGNIGRNDISIKEFIINLRGNFVWNFKEKKDTWKDKKKNLILREIQERGRKHWREWHLNRGVCLINLWDTHLRGNFVWNLFEILKKKKIHEKIKRRISHQNLIWYFI